MKTAYLILHDLRSAQNVGSLFRTADAAGISKVFLTGYTPAPLDRFKRPVKEIAKTALGAEELVPWEKISLEECLNRLTSEGAHLVAIEQSKHSLPYREVKPRFPLALVLGNEVSGLPPEVLSRCETIAEIPMYGAKESLNVAVAGGIALFEILKR